MIEYIERCRTTRKRTRRLGSKPGGNHGRFGECRAPRRRRFRFHFQAAQASDRRQVGRPQGRQELQGVRPGDRRADRPGGRGRPRGYRPRRQGGTQGLRGRSVVEDQAGRARQDGVAPGRPPGKAPGRAGRDREPRQRQAGQRCQGRRPAVRLRASALHGRLVDQDHRPEHSDLRAGRLACLFDARAGRRGRPDHSVELPAADGGLEDRAGAGGGLHHRAEARRADAAQRAAAGRAGDGGGLPARRAQHRDRRRRAAAPHWPPIPTSTRWPSPARPRSAS